MDVPTLRRREKGVVVRLESHCSDHCPARFLRGLVPSGRRSALIAGMGRRGGGPRAAVGSAGRGAQPRPLCDRLHSAWGPRT